jgi:hypothetical protein
MKFVAARPFADPEVAARKLLEIANSVEPLQDGRIFIEKINLPFLSEFNGCPRRVQRRPQARDRTRLAVDARERHLCEVHADRR